MLRNKECLFYVILQQIFCFSSTDIWKTAVTRNGMLCWFKCVYDVCTFHFNWLWEESMGFLMHKVSMWWWKFRISYTQLTVMQQRNAQLSSILSQCIFKTLWSFICLFPLCSQPFSKTDNIFLHPIHLPSLTFTTTPSSLHPPPLLV